MIHTQRSSSIGSNNSNNSTKTSNSSMIESSSSLSMMMLRPYSKMMSMATKTKQQKKKKVSFPSRKRKLVSVRKIAPICATDEIWYSQSEYQQMREEILSTRSYSNSDNEVCRRGLESCFGRKHESKTQTRHALWKGVIEEQDYQYYNNIIVNESEESIALICRSISQKCVERAQKRGLKDALEVK